MKLSSFTDLGMVRQNNEDACLVVPPWNNLAIKQQACIFAVADGMGGQNAGEIAASIAVQTARDWFASCKSISAEPSLLEEAIIQINSAVWGHSQNNPETSGMGNTLTLMLIKDKRAVVAHIGDTRLYRLRKNELKQITNDHSLIAEQIRTGKITPDLARLHPAKHILSRVIGSREFVTPDVFEIELNIDDIFLICSDGVFNMIEDSKIKSILQKNPIRSVAKKLVEASNSAGGKDNATAVVFAIERLPIKFPNRYSLDRLKSFFFTK